MPSDFTAATELPRPLAAATRVCALLHDLGKLRADWQCWAESAQRSLDASYMHGTALAHTDFDPSDPRERARERALPLRRPAHAPASAYFARLFIAEALEPVPADKRALVTAACLAAILAHHGGWWPRQFSDAVPALWPGWDALVRQVVPSLSTTPDMRMLERYKVENLLDVVVGPERVDEAWPLLAFLTRTLRLSDQRATAEAGCHE